MCFVKQGVKNIEKTKVLEMIGEYGFLGARGEYTRARFILCIVSKLGFYPIHSARLCLEASVLLRGEFQLLRNTAAHVRGALRGLARLWSRASCQRSFCFSASLG